MNIETIKKILLEKLGKLAKFAIEPVGTRVYISVSPDDIIKVMKVIKEHLKCDFSAASGFNEKSSFTLVYMLFNSDSNFMLNVRSMTDDMNNAFPSITRVFPDASWAQEEISKRHDISFVEDDKLDISQHKEELIDVYESVLSLDVESIM